MTIFSTCSFGLLERSTENSTGCVHRIHTRSVHHEQYSLLTSTDHICACGSSSTAQELQRHHCSHEEQFSSLVRHVISLLVSSTSSHFQSTTTRSTDSTTFSKTTLYTEHYFQNVHSRQAALTNRSRTSITRVAETRAIPLPHAMQSGRVLDKHTVVLPVPAHEE